MIRPFFLYFFIHLLLACSAVCSDTSEADFFKAGEAVADSDTKALQKILDAKPELAKAAVEKYTLLHQAKDKKIAEILLEKGADLNAKDKYGGIPLHSTSLSFLFGKRHHWAKAKKTQRER